MTRGAFAWRSGWGAVLVRAILYLPLIVAELAGAREVVMLMVLDVPAVILGSALGAVLRLVGVSLGPSSTLDMGWHVIGFTAWYLLGTGCSWLYVKVRGRRGRRHRDRNKTGTVVNARREG